MKAAARPCPSCPWRVDQGARDIPNFDLPLAEGLAATSPDARGMGPDFGAPMFACHQSKIGSEIPCAGWLAKVGHRHPGVRLAVMQGKLDPETLVPGADWPELHDNYIEVLDKLRATHASEDSMTAQTEGMKAILARVKRSPLPLVYGRNGWRAAVALPKPAKRADLEALLKSRLVRIVAGNLLPASED
ncbi:hypothetical protein WJ68_16130 [Burkholderia ubonensis]|uniref:Uncharacterized protein n=1 Tax=Burkholderia ubonensis TaxID=101571 RepID=A0ABD4E177_9BURK|nr:hypothetical protein WJ68_16130 [Burkholderia ubonensis]